MDARDVLREKEDIIVEVEKLNAKVTDATTKITRLQADLDHEAAVQQGQEMEMERIRAESKEREALLKQPF